MNTIKIKTFIFTAILIATAIITSCSTNDGDDGSGSGGGGGGGGGSSFSLKGTSWERIDQDGISSNTHTITFTTESEMTYNQKGWIDLSSLGGSFSQHNETTNGTYVFYYNIMEGWINNYTISNTGTLIFTISSDRQRLISTNIPHVFTRK